ncbi:nitroreductase family protein [Coprobacter tertius]|uniref:Nitroreductase family protein n=1 Tax=Coprobacter tertius TaxID=2944915 RepID=A0ABT1MEE9_9BACT|nr:nitroreductase family protein [Coprobacter tertius]MCP9610993.1 nitroreductase family protein [Coprobacter tertius]
MDFLELAEKRQSDRAFDPERKIEPEKIKRILEAARIAPSACNAQPWHFIVVNNPELKNKIADATSTKVLGMNHFTKQAPVHILIVEENANFTSNIGSWVKNKHFPYIDIGIAAAHITLAAAAEGIGSCIIGWFDEKNIKKLLGIPSSKRILLDILLGYSTQEHRNKKRKLSDEIITYNRYEK